MALWKPFRGNRSSLDIVEKHDGYVYFCVDDGSLFFDYADADGVLQRKQINAKDAETLCGMSLEELKEYVSTQDAVVLGESQAYTDAAIAAIDLPIEATDDEVMALLSRQNVVTACSDATGYTYTDIDEKILTL